MYEVVVEAQFSAAHRLVQYQGNCERLHGHNWRVKALVRGETLDSQGLLLDYRALRKELGGILQELDHSLLNDHPDFARANPTSEHLAEWIFRRLAARVESDRCALEAVEVYETDSTMARFSR